MFLLSVDIPPHQLDGRLQWRLGLHVDSPEWTWQPHQIPAMWCGREGGSVDTLRTMVTALEKPPEPQRLSDRATSCSIML